MPSWAPSHPNHRCATAVAHLGSPSWAPSWAPVRAVSGLLRAPLGHFGSPPTRPIDVQRPLHIPGPLVDPARARLEAFFGPYGRPSAPSGKTPDLTRRCATAVAHRGAPSWAPSWARLRSVSGPMEAPPVPSWTPSHPNQRCATAVAHPGGPSGALPRAQVGAVSSLLRAPLVHVVAPLTTHRCATAAAYAGGPFKAPLGVFGQLFGPMGALCALWKDPLT